MEAVRQDADRTGPRAVGDLGHGNREVQQENLEEYARDVA